MNERTINFDILLDLQQLVSSPALLLLNHSTTALLLLLEREIGPNSTLYHSQTPKSSFGMTTRNYWNCRQHCRDNMYIDKKQSTNLVRWLVYSADESQTSICNLILSTSSGVCRSQYSKVKSHFMPRHGQG